MTAKLKISGRISRIHEIGDERINHEKEEDKE